MEPTMHVRCEPTPGQHIEFDFSVNTVSSEEWLFLKQLLSVNQEVRNRWSALCYHHNALYNIIRQKAATCWKVFVEKTYIKTIWSAGVRNIFAFDACTCRIELAFPD